MHAHVYYQGADESKVVHDQIYHFSAPRSIRDGEHGPRCSLITFHTRTATLAIVHCHALSHPISHQYTRPPTRLAYPLTTHHMGQTGKIGVATCQAHINERFQGCAQERLAARSRAPARKQAEKQQEP